jgi:hypothetical protein
LPVIGRQEQRVFGGGHRFIAASQAAQCVAQNNAHRHARSSSSHRFSLNDRLLERAHCEQTACKIQTDLVGARLMPHGVCIRRTRLFKALLHLQQGSQQAKRTRIYWISLDSLARKRFGIRQTPLHPPYFGQQQ